MNGPPSIHPAVDSSPVYSKISKEKKPSAKQGGVYAAFCAQEFGQDDSQHHGHKFVVNLNKKLASNVAQSPHFQ